MGRFDAMKDAVNHMNDDHSDVLLDFVRFYGHAPYHVTGATLTENLSLSQMEIAFTSFRDSKLIRNLVCVPFLPPLKHETELRARLKHMAYIASIERIPEWRMPSLVISATLLLMFLLFGVVTHVPQETTNRWFGARHVHAAYGISVLLFGSARNARFVFYAGVGIHLSEAVFCALKLYSKLKKGGRGWSRVLAWTLQTAVVGFPSLMMLGEILGQTESKKEK